MNRSLNTWPPRAPGEADAVEDGDVSVTDLVVAAREGDQSAWNSLVVRFTPLVLSVISRYRMNEPDAADVSQTVWLRLVQHLPSLRQPAALPGWIVTTAGNECLRVIRIRQRTASFDPLVEPPRNRGTVTQIVSDDIDTDLLADERHEALLTAFAELPDKHRELLALLLADPPLSYAEISDRLGMAIGGIGPTRARALDRLRRSPSLAALIRSNELEDQGR
jgi:RNA polymerase sigma factor (sigma-70 family)